MPIPVDEWARWLARVEARTGCEDVPVLRSRLRACLIALGAEYRPWAPSSLAVSTMPEAPEPKMQMTLGGTFG